MIPLVLKRGCGWGNIIVDELNEYRSNYENNECVYSTIAWNTCRSITIRYDNINKTCLDTDGLMFTHGFMHTHGFTIPYIADSKQEVCEVSR